VTNGVVTAINVINGGVGYSSSSSITVAIYAPGGATRTAAGTALMQVDKVTIGDSGSGYTSPLTVAFAGGNGTGVCGSAIIGPPGYQFVISKSSSPVAIGGVYWSSAIFSTVTCPYCDDPIDQNSGSISLSPSGGGATGNPTLTYSDG